MMILRWMLWMQQFLLKIMDVLIARNLSCIHERGILSVDPQFLLLGYWDDNGTPPDESDDFRIDGAAHCGLGMEPLRPLSIALSQKMRRI